MVMRLHAGMVQRHARQVVGWLQVVVIVRLAAVVVVRRGSGGAATAVVDAVDAVLKKIRARCRPFMVVIVIVR